MCLECVCHYPQFTVAHVCNGVVSIEIRLRTTGLVYSSQIPFMDIFWMISTTILTLDQFLGIFACLWQQETNVPLDWIWCAGLLFYLYYNIPVFWGRCTENTTSPMMPSTQPSLKCSPKPENNTVGDVDYPGNISYLSFFSKLNSNTVTCKISKVMSARNPKFQSRRLIFYVFKFYFQQQLSIRTKSFPFNPLSALPRD